MPTPFDNLIDKAKYETEFCEHEKLIPQSILQEFKQDVASKLIECFAGSAEKMIVLYQTLSAQQNADGAAFDFNQLVKDSFGPGKSNDKQKIISFVEQLIAAIQKFYLTANEQNIGFLLVVDLVNYCLTKAHELDAEKLERVAHFKHFANYNHSNDLGMLIKKKSTLKF